MFDTFLAVIPAFFESLFTLEMLIALVVGIVGGLIIGALPGFSAPMGIALLMPMTYSMQPIPALTMLMAIYTSAILGGSFTAILVHVPGTPSSAATLLDGYQMTQKGQAKKALATSIFASAWGGIISAIALLVISPPLAQVSLLFNAPEYFLLGVFSMTIIASLSEKDMMKGFAVGALGLLLSTIGQDMMKFYPRMTFGSYYLDASFNSTAVLVGMFSVPQIIKQFSTIRNSTKDEKIELPEMNGHFWLTVKEQLFIMPTILRGSIIGIFTGILPGAGGAIGAFLSYNNGKRFAKDKENYGKGSIEGVAAPESANNAVSGGAMIPLLTLGIPGSSAAAVLLGGLLIQGLQPGLTLFTTHAATTYSVILGFLLVNIVLLPLGIMVAGVMGNIVRIPAAMLTPFIAMFAVVGAYSLSGNMFNVYVMLGFGLLGYFMSKHNYLNTALILGMLLGYRTENGFRQSLVMCRGDLLGYFLSRPACLLLLALTIAGVLIPIIQKRKKAKAAA